jgi:hypothetical protein
MPNMGITLLAGVSGRNPKLLDQVRGVIRRKHFSIRTEQAYTDWIRRFILYHGKRHPREMAEAEVVAFLTHLARDGNVAASTQNQHVKAALTCQGRIGSNNVLRVRAAIQIGSEFVHWLLGEFAAPVCTARSRSKLFHLLWRSMEIDLL